MIDLEMDCDSLLKNYDCIVNQPLAYDSLVTTLGVLYRGLCSGLTVKDTTQVIFYPLQYDA